MMFGTRVSAVAATKGFTSGCLCEGMDDADHVGDEMPQVLVEEFLERETGARRLLEELERQQLEGEHEAVRERIRALAASDAAVFYTVALALTGSRQFFGDVEAQLDVTAADRLRDLAETHPSLEEPFGLVRTEETRDRWNPVTGLSATTRYHAEEEVPLVDYCPHSGSMELFEARQSPEEVLEVATYLVQSASDGLEWALEHDNSVNTEELSTLIDRREELESELSGLRDLIDALRRTPVDE